MQHGAAQQQGHKSPKLFDVAGGILRTKQNNYNNEQSVTDETSKLSYILIFSSLCRAFCGARHFLQNGYDSRTIQESYDHNDVRATMIYTHVIQQGGQRVRSPADMI